MSEDIKINYPAPRPFDDLDMLTQTFDVSDPLSEQLASDTLNQIVDFRDQAEAHRVRMAKPIREALGEVNGYWKPIINRAEDARVRLADKIARYREQVKRGRLALEQKARAEARAEQERLASEAAEREREGRDNAQRLRTQAEQLAQAGNTTSAAELRARADQAELGAQQDAQSLVEQAQQVIPFSVPTAPRAEGIQERTVWDYELVDLDAVVAAACPKCNPDGKARGLLELNKKATRSRVISQKDAFDVPGIIARPTTQIAATGE